jgi:hypothetical protein
LLYYMWKHFLLPQLQRQKRLSSWVLTTSPHSGYLLLSQPE